MLRASRQGRRGSSMVEFAMLMPWYAFLFAGAFDYGFYSYGLIATQTAARVAAMYCSGSVSLAQNCGIQACNYALDQLRDMPNVGSAISTCSSSPVVVTTSMVSGTGTGGSPDGADAAQVTVAYTTPPLIPIPGIAAGSITIYRTAIMRVLT